MQISALGPVVFSVAWSLVNTWCQFNDTKKLFYYLKKVKMTSYTQSNMLTFKLKGLVDKKKRFQNWENIV